jgi:uncharacterized protein YkwD
MTRLVVSLVAVLVAAVVATGPAAPRALADARLGRSERNMVRLINDVRQRHGLGRLGVSHALSRAAEGHSQDMLRRDFFDHPSSDGTPPFTRIRRYVDASSIGETLALVNRRHGGAATVVRMWMGSPPHRAVLLGSGFHRIGLARRWGRLGSSMQSVVTADFASRR